MTAVKKIEQQTSIKGMGAVLAARMTQIKSVVASQVTPEKMCRIALNELRLNDSLRNAALAKPDSFINAVLQASHLGLEIGGALGQCYLVPFGGEVKAMVGYRGLLTLARRSGFITSIKAEMVYENDTFELELGIDTKVVHKPCLTGDRGKEKLVYMVAHFTDGGHHFEWMSIDDVNKIRSRSPSKNSGPWKDHYEQMALKTVIRRGWKFLPMSIEMQKTEVIEHASDTGKSLVIDGDSIEIDPSSDDGDVEDENSPSFEQIKASIENSAQPMHLAVLGDQIEDHKNASERKILTHLSAAKLKSLETAPQEQTATANNTKKSQQNIDDTTFYAE